MRNFRSRPATTPRLFVLALLLVLSGSAQRGKGLFQVTVRDAQTHFAVDAELHFQGPETRTVHADVEGHVTARLDPGEYQIEVSAPGYKVMRTHYRVSHGRNRLGIMLEPEILPYLSVPKSSRGKPAPASPCCMDTQ